MHSAAAVFATQRSARAQLGNHPEMLGRIGSFERGESNAPGILKCDRPSDDARIYWDSNRRAIVVVKDGKIVTYFKPEGPPPADFDYWLAQCNA